MSLPKYLGTMFRLSEKSFYLYFISFAICENKKPKNFFFRNGDFFKIGIDRYMISEYTYKKSAQSDNYNKFYHSLSLFHNLSFWFCWFCTDSFITNAVKSVLIIRSSWFLVFIFRYHLSIDFYSKKVSVSKK